VPGCGDEINWVVRVLVCGCPYCITARSVSITRTHARVRGEKGGPPNPHNARTRGPLWCAEHAGRITVPPSSA
jgi:hypothetical protein